MFRVVERSKLSRKFGNDTFMDCHLSSEEEEDEFVAETLRTTIRLDVDDDDDDDFEENTTGDDFVAASNILNKSAKGVKDFFLREVRVRLLRTRAYCFHAREKKKKQKKQVSL